MVTGIFSLLQKDDPSNLVDDDASTAVPQGTDKTPDVLDSTLKNINPRLQSNKNTCTLKTKKWAI